MAGVGKIEIIPAEYFSHCAHPTWTNRRRVVVHFTHSKHSNARAAKGAYARARLPKINSRNPACARSHATDAAARTAKRVQSGAIFRTEFESVCVYVCSCEEQKTAGIRNLNLRDLFHLRVARTHNTCSEYNLMNNKNNMPHKLASV